MHSAFFSNDALRAASSTRDYTTLGLEAGNWGSGILAHSALACGSMVLYLYGVLFFAPQGKNNTQRIENDPQAKVLDMLFGLSAACIQALTLLQWQLWRLPPALQSGTQQYDPHFDRRR
jgi:hypothetical protein